jgi:hypothetical protein
MICLPGVAANSSIAVITKFKSSFVTFWKRIDFKISFLIVSLAYGVFGMTLGVYSAF